jgi:hypothetical protein
MTVFYARTETEGELAIRSDAASWQERSTARLLFAVSSMMGRQTLKSAVQCV